MNKVLFAHSCTHWCMYCIQFFLHARMAALNHWNTAWKAQITDDLILRGRSMFYYSISTRAERCLPCRPFYLQACHTACQLHGAKSIELYECEEWMKWTYELLFGVIRNLEWCAWLGSSVVKSTCCVYTRPGFSYQHPHNGSQHSVTPSVGDLMPPFDLCGRQACNEHSYMQGKHPYVQNQINKSEKAGWMKAMERSWWKWVWSRCNSRERPTTRDFIPVARRQLQQREGGSLHPTIVLYSFPVKEYLLSFLEMGLISPFTEVSQRWV